MLPVSVCSWKMDLKQVVKLGSGGRWPECRNSLSCSHSGSRWKSCTFQRASQTRRASRNLVRPFSSSVIPLISSSSYST